MGLISSGLVSSTERGLCEKESIMLDWMVLLHSCFSYLLACSIGGTMR